MSRPTSAIRNSIGKSIGAGMASVFGGSGRTYCVLQHRTNSKKHKLGEKQEIIVDYAEIGRDPKCVIRFGDDLPMVSRIHASLEREGTSWVIHHLSKVNQTLVNGRPVNRKWYLNNGDIIQLSSNGPSLGFILPQNPAINSIGLSRRLSLFREQALRPYKTVITILSVILVLSIGGLSFFLYNTAEKLSVTQKELADARVLSTTEIERLHHDIDSLAKNDVKRQRELTAMRRKLREIENRPPPAPQQSAQTSETGVDLTALYPSVCVVVGVSITASANGEEETIEFTTIGTGFFLEDGRFVTARHVVEPWYFINIDEPDENLLPLNIFASNGGQLTLSMKVLSPDGSRYEYTSDQFTIDRTRDEIRQLGDNKFIRLAGFRNSNDWAVLTSSRRGSIKPNYSLSTSLRPTQELYVLGYPYGVGIDGNAITPQLTKVTVTQAGLSGGLINIAGDIDHGNSGGPVFAIVEGEPQAVGIVSSGIGTAMKFLVPIESLRQ